MRKELRQPIFGRCNVHPEVDTGLTCVRCGKYICPRCMVQTAVGARCQECGKAQTIPAYVISLRQYIVAFGVSVSIGAVVGIAWGFLLAAIGWIFFIPWLLAMGAGYVIGESVTTSVNRKRGSGLAAVSVVGVVMAFVLALAIGSGFSIGDLVFGLLFLCVAIYITVSRTR